MPFAVPTPWLGRHPKSWAIGLFGSHIWATGHLLVTGRQSPASHLYQGRACPSLSWSTAAYTRKRRPARKSVGSTNNEDKEGQRKKRGVHPSVNPAEVLPQKPRAAAPAAQPRPRTSRSSASPACKRAAETDKTPTPPDAPPDATRPTPHRLAEDSMVTGTG